MSKRLSRWSEFILCLMTQAKLENGNISLLSSQKIFPIITRSLLLLGIVLFWCWNWKLLLATVVGIGLMLLVYLAQTHYWYKYWRICQRLLRGWNGKLAVAVGSGGIGAFITYMIAAIWADTENRWLATGSILQVLGTLTILVLLGWHLWGKQNQQQETKFNELSQDLTACDPLKRLIAIRQLTVLVSTHKVPRKYYGWLIEYYHLMLSQSQETIVQEALLEGLESLDTSFSRESTKQPLKIPLKVPLNALYRSYL